MRIVLKGGTGSGHHGHSGRLGKRGGSLPRSSSSFIGAVLQGDRIKDDTAIQHLNAGLERKWERATKAIKTDVKKDIISNIASKTEFTEHEVNNAIWQWSHTSNGTSLSSLSLQEAASEEFGIEMSAWQKGRMDEARQSVQRSIEAQTAAGYTDILINDNPVNNWSREQERTFLRTMYDNTQQQLSSAGYKPDDVITLYRGYSTKARLPIQRLNYTGNAMESWSVSDSVAIGFAGGGRGIAITAQIRVRDILSTARTGFGCLEEGEFVVLGSSGGIESVIIKGNEHVPPIKE